MNSLYTLRKIPYQSTWTIRHEVMWPNKPFDYIKLQGDESGIHYGLFVDKKLVSTISLFIDQNGKEAQFRKFATIETFQGKGFGSALLKHLFLELETLKVERVWCNARLHKANFYERFGMSKTEKTFLRGEMEYVIMEKKIIND